MNKQRTSKKPCMCTQGSSKNKSQSRIPKQLSMVLQPFSRGQSTQLASSPLSPVARQSPGRVLGLHRRLWISCPRSDSPKPLESDPQGDPSRGPSSSCRPDLQSESVRGRADRKGVQRPETWIGSWVTHFQEGA